MGELGAKPAPSWKTSEGFIGAQKNSGCHFLTGFNLSPDLNKHLEPGLWLESHVEFSGMFRAMGVLLLPQSHRAVPCRLPGLACSAPGAATCQKTRSSR